MKQDEFLPRVEFRHTKESLIKGINAWVSKRLKAETHVHGLRAMTEDDLLKLAKAMGYRAGQQAYQGA